MMIQVTSPYGHHYHYADSVESGDFAFTAAEGGDYMACFWAPDHKPPFTLSIDFEWKTGFAAKDWSKVAKKDQIEVSVSNPTASFVFLFDLHILLCG